MNASAPRAVPEYALQAIRRLIEEERVLWARVVREGNIQAE